MFTPALTSGTPSDSTKGPNLVSGEVTAAPTQSAKRTTRTSDVRRLGEDRAEEQAEPGERADEHQKGPLAPLGGMPTAAAQSTPTAIVRPRSGSIAVMIAAGAA